MTRLRLKRQCQRWILRIFKRAGAPKEIAAGMAVGLFVAVLPTLGVQLPLVLGVTILLRKLGFPISTISAAGGVWLTNPITAVPLYTLTYFLGLPLARLLMSTPAEAAMVESANAVLSLEGLSSQGGQTVLALTLGGVLLGLPLAYIGYRLTLRASERFAARSRRLSG